VGGRHTALDSRRGRRILGYGNRGRSRGGRSWAVAFATWSRHGCLDVGGSFFFFLEALDLLLEEKARLDGRACQPARAVEIGLTMNLLSS